MVRRRDDFERIRDASQPRIAYEELLAAAHADAPAWDVVGYCEPCEAAVPLHVERHDGHVNYREHLLCPRCRLNNRQRFSAELARRWGTPPYYLFEQVTPFYAWARAHLPEVIGSEYLGADIAPGTVVDGIRHEDALGLSLADGSVGTIVSNDVFEHVPDIDAALAECARVLRDDGLLLFSIPFHDTRDETIARASVRDGELVHHLEPEYHGNPVDPSGGSLVFYDYGWDILDRCRAAGFAEAAAIAYWSALKGHLGNGVQLTFAAWRTAPDHGAGPRRSVARSLVSRVRSVMRR